MSRRRRRALTAAVAVVVAAGVGWFAFRAAASLPGVAVPDQGNLHIALPTSPHDRYNSDPPTSGPHLSYLAPWGVHTRPIARELQVHNLEDGGVLVQYSCECPDVVERLWAVVRRYDKVILAPYPGMKPRIALTAWQAREVLVWSTLGCPGSILPVQNPRAIVGPAVRPMLVAKHTTQRLPARGRPTGDGDAVKPHEDTSPAEVAAYASEQFGVSVPVGHVVRLRREGVLELYARLVACGLVPRDGRMATMADTTEATGLERLDVRGWKEIVPLVDHGKRDEKTLRAWAERAENPLPLWFVGGEVCTSRADLAAWSAAELERTRRRPRGATG